MFVSYCEIKKQQADFKLLVKMYCEHALLIPSTPNKFVTYDDLEAFWMEKYNQSGQEQIHTQPSIVFQVSDVTKKEREREREREREADEVL